MRFMRATGNLVLISMLFGLGFLYAGATLAEKVLVEEDEGSDFMRGPREDMVGVGMYSALLLYEDSGLKRGFRCVW